MVERDVVGGAAHLWDCIPSKTMIATGGAISFSNRLEGMGLENNDAEVDVESLTTRIESIKNRMRDNNTEILESQGIRILRGSGRFTGPHTMEVECVDGIQTVEFDAALVSTGSLSDGKFDVLQSGRFHRLAVSMTGDARVLALGVTTTPEGEY